MPQDNTIRISMWSGPRNISTTMMRAFENRPDTVVVDEPLYASYLRASGADHPYRAETLAAMPSDWRPAIKALDAPMPDGKSIRFAKHIAYHYPASEPLDWLTAHRNFLLIRDPRRMVASFSKKFEDVAPIVESYAVARRIFDFLGERRLTCPIVDASDILSDPEAMLRGLCNALEIPFTEKMLSWPPGQRDTDGPWAPHWYDAVSASTGFKKPVEKPDDLPASLAAAAARAAPDYAFLHERRLKP